MVNSPDGSWLDTMSKGRHTAALTRCLFLQRDDFRFANKVVTKSINESLVPAPLHRGRLLDGDHRSRWSAGGREGQSCPALVPQGRALLLFWRDGRFACARPGPAMVLASADCCAAVWCAR